MRKIGKALVVIATIVGIGGAGLAMAQPFGPGGYGPMGGGPGGLHGPGMMGGWDGARPTPAARLDALKAELAIRPEQQAAWETFAKALGDSATRMQAMHAEMFQSMGTAANWQEHQALMAKLFDQRAQVLKTVRDAATKLIAVLDDQQKTRLLLPVLTDAGPGAIGRGGPGMMGWSSGPGMMGWGGGPGMMGWSGRGWGPDGGAR